MVSPYRTRKCDYSQSIILTAQLIAIAIFNRYAAYLKYQFVVLDR